MNDYLCLVYKREQWDMVIFLRNDNQGGLITEMLPTASMLMSVWLQQFTLLGGFFSFLCVCLEMNISLLSSH